MLRRVKDIVCEKCGHNFNTNEHTQCPKCKEKTDGNNNLSHIAFCDKPFKPPTVSDVVKPPTALGTFVEVSVKAEV